MMSRKNYIAVAKILAAHRMTMRTDDWCFMVDDFCTYFKMDNPNFSASKFKEAAQSEPSDMLGRVNASPEDYE